MRKHNWMLITLIFLILIQSLTASRATNASPGADDWRTFRHDTNHSGDAIGNSQTNSAIPLWKYITGGPVTSSPAIAEGYVFFGCKDYNIYCLNASNGQPIWNFPTAAEVESSPSVYNGRVYVSSEDGWIYCLDIATGMPVWISMVGGEAKSSPAVTGDIVFVGSGKNGFFAFNASDGSLVLEVPTFLSRELFTRSIRWDCVLCFRRLPCLCPKRVNQPINLETTHGKRYLFARNI